MITEQHDVVIVGAGPTGLALAAELRRLGTPSLLIDRLAAGANTSRAVVIHARTMEVLEPLGVMPRLLASGIEVPTFCLREGSRVLATISFRELETAFPFILTCPQDQTEAILLSRLQELGGSVHRPCEATALRPLGDGVELDVNTATGTETIRARWLIGCDGGHSLIRESSGIAFEGGAYGENFMLADLEMSWPFGHDEGGLFFSEKGILLVVPLTGDNRFRLIALVDEAPKEPTISDFQQILDERGPEGEVARISRMNWASRFHIQHRIAKRLRSGHVLLAGDAAHVHSPAGGQGMNTGIQDAVALAAALHEALATGSTAALDAWETRRLQIARSVVSVTDHMTRIGVAQSGPMKFFRNTALEIMAHLPAAQHMLARKLSELDNR